MSVSTSRLLLTPRRALFHRSLPSLTCDRPRMAGTMAGKTGHLERTAREPREKVSLPDEPETPVVISM